MPDISVIIPVYNSGKYLHSCIDSIVVDSSDIEIILINDGSTDASAQVCELMASKDKRIRVIHKQNGGVSTARNLGLTFARGEWITFLDSDDTLPAEALDSMFRLTDDNIDVVFAGYSIIGGNGSLKIPPIKTDKMTSQELARQLFAPTDYPYLGYICSKLFRRSVIERYNVRFDEAVKYNEDRLFSFEFLSHARGGAYTTKPVYNYIQRGDSAMAKIEGSDFWKFETDLDAFVKMCRLVNVFKDKELERLVRIGTIASYNRNITLNSQYGNNSAETNRRLRQKLRSAIPISFIVRFRLAALKGALCYKLKQFFK